MRAGTEKSLVASLVATLATSLVATLLASLVATSAAAFIPDSDRTLREISRVNRSSGRTQALQMDVTMRIGERDPIAAGQLITHPTGLARLELRGYSGRIDRYVLSGSELSGAKDGERLRNPQPLLQPLFLLQPSSETTLRAALATFGVETSLIGLAPCGDQDCFVFGDPRLAPRSSRRGDTRGDGNDGLLSGPSLGGTGFGSGVGNGFGISLGEDAAGGGMARFWVDTKDLQVRRVDRDNGVFMLLGPMTNFAKIMAPAWIEIHEPGAEPVRFEVERAVQVNAPPTAFSQQWLMGLPTDFQRQQPAGAPDAAGLPSLPGQSRP